VVPQLEATSIIFQQDGVTTHWHTLVRNSMNQMFLVHQIGWRR
jgi:hypothetical protein